MRKLKVKRKGRKGEGKFFKFREPYLSDSPSLDQFTFNFTWSALPNVSAFPSSSRSLTWSGVQWLGNLNSHCRQLLRRYPLFTSDSFRLFYFSRYTYLASLFSSHGRWARKRGAVSPYSKFQLLETLSRSISSSLYKHSYYFCWFRSSFPHN